MRLARDLPVKAGETLDGDRVTEPLLQRPSRANADVE
jgi:hypothetical protein